MPKPKQGMLRLPLSNNIQNLPTTSYHAAKISRDKIHPRSEKETTPPPKEIYEMNTPSPVRLSKLMDRASGLDKTTPPLSRLKLPKNTYIKYSIDNLQSLVVVTLVAHQFAQTITSKISPIDENTAPTSPSFIRTPVDHFYANIARKKSEKLLSPKSKSPDSPKQPIYTHHKLKFPNDMTTTEHIKFFPSDAKTSKNMKLGTYRDISKKLEQIKKESHISDRDIAEFIDSIEYGRHTISRLSTEDIKYLVNVSSLLFSTESSRHPSSYIIHKMFIDLVKAGIYSFNEMGAILPMALPGAVKATITIDKILFTKVLKADLYYDSSNARSPTQKKLQTFTSRIDKIVTDWLKAKGCRDITELGQYQFIKESLKVWYPTEPIDSSQNIQEDSDGNTVIQAHLPLTRKRKSEEGHAYRKKIPYSQEADDSTLGDTQDFSSDESSPTSPLLGDEGYLSWEAFNL